MDTPGRTRIEEEFMKKKSKGIRDQKTCKKKESKGKTLDDDVIPNILSRLPARNVMQCRLVHKGWRDLTSTRDFIDLHFRYPTNNPMIFVANPSWYGPKHQLPRTRWDHLLLDHWCERAQSKLTIRTFPFEPRNIEFVPEIIDYRAQFSHAGLLVFQESVVGEVIIVNPIFHQKVRITIPMDFQQSQVYGVFYHPLVKEYCCLWGMKEVPWGIRGMVYPPYEPPTPIVFKILNLGSIPVMKTICNPFPQRFKRWYSYPILIDMYLYWMLESEEEEESYEYSGCSDIMQFDIIGEEFSVKPCPVPVDTECNRNQTHILIIDGALAFVVLFPSKITIWRLKDDAEELWSSAVNYTFDIDNSECIPYPIAVVDGNLAILSRRRLLVCNLMQGTMSYFRKKYHDGVSFLSHSMSLSSLENCQSSIYLDGNGNAYLKENGPNLVVEDIDNQDGNGDEYLWENGSNIVIEGIDNQDGNGDDYLWENDPNLVVEDIDNQDGNDDDYLWENIPNLVNEDIDNQVEVPGPTDTHDSISFFEKASIDDEQEDEKSENSWNSDTSDSLAGSQNSNNLVYEGSDSQLESSAGPSIPRGEESTSFEIANTDNDDDEEEEEDSS